MNVDKKREVVDNLVEQWTALSMRDKKEHVFDVASFGVFMGALGNSTRCAAKGNWPAAFYNLAVSGAVLSLVLTVQN